ncbi:putative winged helix-like DNA-binding domain superfamily [Helianthus anomalus]
MSSPHGLKLAAHIISTYFGDIVCKVCECLLRRGPLSQLEVTRFTELTKQKVTDALLVLIHHNCVQAFTIQQPDLKKIIYQAQAQEVESIVLKKYGREAYRIFRLLSERERRIETDKISSTTFVEKKDALKILFQLWKDDYLNLEVLS